MIEYKSLNN